eukprot:4153165-Pyramimonas_sp.AAC.1
MMPSSTSTPSALASARATSAMASGAPPLPSWPPRWRRPASPRGRWGGRRQQRARRAAPDPP